MSKITLITDFRPEELEKVNAMLRDVDVAICKVPYRVCDEKRYEIDNLPYHFTIFATNKDNQEKLIALARSIKIPKITLKVDAVRLMDAVDDSVVVYFSIEENAQIRALQRRFYEEMPEESYNPDNFTFHMTIHVDKDKTVINRVKEQIEKNFEPFELTFAEAVLFDYPGEMITKIDMNE